MGLGFITKSYRNRAMALVLPVVLAAVVLVTVLAYLFILSNVVEFQRENMETALAGMAGSLDSRISEARNTVSVLGSRPLSLTDAAAALELAHAAAPVFFTLFVSDPAGGVITAVGETISEQVILPPFETFDTSIPENGRRSVFIGSVERIPPSMTPVFLLAVPVRLVDPARKGREIDAVAGGYVDINRLFDSCVASFVPLRTSHVFLADAAGKTLARSGDDVATSVFLAKSGGVKESETLFHKDAGGTRYLSVVRPCLDGWWVVGLSVPVKALFTHMGRLVAYSILLGFITIALVSLVTWLVTGMMVGMINRLADNLRNIVEGKGDLTRRLEVRGADEIAELATWFNRFVEKLGQMITSIAQKASRVDEAARVLQEFSGEMTQTAGSLRNLSKAVVTSTDEMNMNMASVSTTMEEYAHNLDTMASATEQMTATIDQITESSGVSMKRTNQAVSYTNTVHESVKDLNESMETIGGITDTIARISGQTNLLALNAAIEAARAGEKGRGFAVVAGEIKTLAGETDAATSNIHSRVSDIQGSSRSTLEAIEKIADIIHTIDEVVSTTAAALEQQSASTKEIAANIMQASSGIQDVHKRISQSSSMLGGVAREIKTLDDRSRVIFDKSEAINRRSAELAVIADELNIMAKQYKV
ncbi:MAG: methyl-accepting chemotaxis protein [Thermodesulfobacteriota bacterium]